MADKNDAHGLFGGLNAIYGLRSNAAAPVKNGDGSQLLTNMQGGRNTSVISSTNKVQQTHIFVTWFSQEKSGMSSQYSSLTLSWRKH